MHALLLKRRGVRDDARLQSEETQALRSCIDVVSEGLPTKRSLAGRR
jgi:hypothetical protein